MEHFLDEMADKCIEEIKEGVEDMANGEESATAEMLNDKFVMCDMLGNKLFDIVPLLEIERKILRERLAYKIWKRAHQALKDACEMFMKSKGVDNGKKLE